MIVYRKTPNDLMRERKERKLSCAPERPLCVTYVVTKDGDCIDTDQLTETQILAIARQAILLSAQAHKEGRVLRDNLVIEANCLMEVVKPHYQPTLAGMKVMIPLLQHADNVVQGFARDVLLTTAERGGLARIQEIARFFKESQGNFDPLTGEDLLRVVNQMQVNEQRRQERATVTEQSR